MTTDSTAIATLRARAAAIICGAPEDVMDEEFIRALAIVEVEGHKSELTAVYRRLQDKFKKDFRVSDLKERVSEMVRDLRQAAAPPPITGWERGLIRKKGSDGEDGPPAACEHNAILYFRNHPEWKGKLAWNEFTSEPVVRHDMDAIGLKKGNPFTDSHDTLIQMWFQEHTGEPKWSIEVVRRAIDIWGKDNAFHPVKEYLEALPPWDGTPRLGHWLSSFCGAGPSESDDSLEAVNLASFIAAIGERWMISGIARIYEPGCEVHHVLVLEGAKGLGKSTLVRTLFGEWSGAIVGDVATKDSQALLSSGIWCLELDELGILGKSAMNSVKSWVTRPFEKFRPAYGHRIEKHPRQVIFLATVDREDWADEEDRRWWPVMCHRQFDLAGLKQSKDQLWAEALLRYREGKRWHFDTTEDAPLIKTAKQEQAYRVPENVLSNVFVKAAIDAAEKAPGQLYGSVSVPEVLEYMQIPLEKRKGLQSDVGKCLKRAGWTTWAPRIDGEQKKRYRNLQLYEDYTGR